MLHRNTVTAELLDTALALTRANQLSAFRMAGGTALALQIGHRKSIDIDFFSNAKVTKRNIVEELKNIFPSSEFFITQDSIRATLNGVRVEIYDDWHTPFLDSPVMQDGIRIASLNDLAAFKLDALIERREKKDYIDLHFLFRQLGAQNILREFKRYNPHVSVRSILFALGEVNAARENKSVMPEMLVDVDWKDISEAMIDAAREYIATGRRKD